MNFAKSSSIYFDNAAYIVIFQVGTAQLANVTTITAITKITIHFITVGINTKKSYFPIWYLSASIDKNVDIVSDDISGQFIERQLLWPASLWSIHYQYS